MLETNINDLSILSVLLYYHHVALRKMPMQHTAIFHGCKNVHFQMKIFNIFLIFAQNINIEAVLTSTHNLCFGAKIRKKYTPINPSFTI